MVAEKEQKIFDREFIVNFLAQFTFSFVSFILIPTIPIYLSKFQAKEGEVGFLVGIFSICSLIPRPFMGRALQRRSERKFMMAGAILYILSSFAYLWASPFWPFLIVRILQGVGLAFFSTASFVLIANIASGTYRGRIISYYYLSFNFAFALAPYFGMLLINHFNFRVLFLVCAGFSLCTLFTTAQLTKIQGVSEENQAKKDQPLFTPEAFPPALIAFALNIIWGSLGAFIPLYALEHGVSNPGIFFAVFAIMLILGRGLGGRILDLYDRKKVIMPCLITIIVSMVMLQFSTTLFMFILVAIILGTGWAFLYPSLALYLIENSESTRGSAISIFTALGDLGTGIGPMIMGIILQWTGYSVMFLCLAFISILNVVYFYYAIVKKGRALTQ
jgi:MFS family permease